MTKMILGNRNLVILAALLLSACGGGSSENPVTSQNTLRRPVANFPAKPPVERELDAMKTAGFTYIYVIKRKDGGQLQADDRGAIKKLTADANRRAATDDGLGVVIGTNTALKPDEMKGLNGQFAVDDHSGAPPANSNGNSNAKK